MHNEARIASLREHRKALIEYLRVKTLACDWHGVSDAANDLREVDVELAVWVGLPERVAEHNGARMGEAAEAPRQPIQPAAQTQTVGVVSMDFHAPMGGSGDTRELHALFSDYGFQRFVISKFGATPSDIGDYDWTDYCVHNYIGNDGGSGAKLDQLIEEYRGAAHVNKLPNIS